MKQLIMPALTKALGAAFRYLRSCWRQTAEGPSLPEELIVEVLVKLPVKSLVRCRCVCRTWSHLIKSTDFVKMHLDYQKSNENFLLLCNRRKRDVVSGLISLHSLESPGFSLPYFNLRPVELCGSCDGLVCLLRQDNKVILCNPVMREFRPLPSYPFPWDDDIIICSVGLGFASITNDYKVIVLVNVINEVNDTEEEKAIVYSLSTNSWREIHSNIPLTTCGHWDRRGTLFEGALHWIDRAQGTITSFDVNNEMFSDVELPRTHPTGESERQLTVFNQSLALFTYGRCSQSDLVNIWVMHKYGVKESWTKQLTYRRLGCCHPVLSWKNEAIIVKDLNGKLDLVSLGTHKTNSYYIQGIVEPVREVMLYLQTLISIK